MSISVVYTAEARCDLRNIYEYIAYDLYAPKTAAEQAKRIMEKIRGLGEIPMNYRLYDKEPWRSLGLRFFPVDKYLVFYLPDEARNTVSIIRIMYGGRDVSKQLSETVK